MLQNNKRLLKRNLNVSLSNIITVKILLERHTNVFFKGSLELIIKEIYLMSFFMYLFSGLGISRLNPVKLKLIKIKIRIRKNRKI